MFPERHPAMEGRLHIADNRKMARVTDVAMGARKPPPKRGEASPSGEAQTGTAIFRGRAKMWANVPQERSTVTGC